MAAEVVESTWWGTKSRHSPEDAIVIALHSLLLSKDCTCTSLSDEVSRIIFKKLQLLTRMTSFLMNILGHN